MAVLLEILRPAGVLGDANDFTYESFFGIAGSLVFTRVPLANYTAGGVVEFVVFKMRGMWSVLEQGPFDPDWFLEWYEGPGGAGLSSGPGVIPGGSESAYTFASANQTTDRQGQPWAQAVLNSLEMRGYADVSDGGSQLETEVRDIDVWAEVWGTIVPPASPHEVEKLTLAADGDETLTLACEGDLSITLRCDVDEEV